MNLSIEVMARETDAGAKLADGFPRGIDVHVTFLPDDTLEAQQRAAAQVRCAGFNAVPHLTARNFVSREALDAHLAALSADAGVTRALVIAGDVDRARGPFSTSLELMRTELLARHGIGSLLVAGHPEGHPSVGEATLDAALSEKLAFAPGATIVTQFCFEAEPIAAWVARQRGRGVTAPIRVGVAGPASIASLLKFAQRCGIGRSTRALRRYGLKLMDASPDEMLHGLRERMPLDAVHVYTFGGLRKTAAWLAGAEIFRSCAGPPRR